MRNLLTAAGLAFALVTAAGLTATAQAQADGKKFEKGSTVTLQGCVVAG